MPNHKPLAAVRSYLWIVLASAIYALGFDWCYVPNQISLGGITGVGQIVHLVIPAIPVGCLLYTSRHQEEGPYGMPPEVSFPFGPRPGTPPAGPDAPHSQAPLPHSPLTILAEWRPQFLPLTL